MSLKEKLARMACRHKWVKVAVFQETDPVRNVRYGIRRYECTECGKISHQDSRCDRLEAKAVNR